MDRVLALAAETGAELVLANDPDADRLAAAVPDPVGPRLPDADAATRSGVAARGRRARARRTPAAGAKLVVTTDRLLEPALAHGARPRRRVPRDAHRLQVDRRGGAARREARASRSCSATRRRSATPCGPLVRDKDGIGAALRLAELARFLKARGLHAARPARRPARGPRPVAPGAVVGGRCPAPRAARASAPRWRGCARAPPGRIGASPVVARARRRRRARSARTERRRPSGLPLSDVLAFQAEDGSRLTVRPSGTEPKIKFYLELTGRAASPAEVESWPRATRRRGEVRARRARARAAPRLTRRRRRRGTGPGGPDPFDPFGAQALASIEPAGSAGPCDARRDGTPCRDPAGSLTQKLVLPLTALVVLVRRGLGLLRTRAVERGYHETMIVGADQLSRSLASATWHAMLADDRPGRLRHDADRRPPAGHQPDPHLQQGGADHVLDRPRGRRGWSTRTPRPACCATRARSRWSGSRRPRARASSPTPDGQRRLAMITPIYNEPSCSTAACHAHPERQTRARRPRRGPRPRPRRPAASRETRGRILLTTALEVLVISAFLVVFIGFFVTRPIHRLIEANAALGADGPRPPGRDRLQRASCGSSRRSFNAMRDRLGEAMAEINRASQELEAKVRRAHASSCARRTSGCCRPTASPRSASSRRASPTRSTTRSPGVLNYSALMSRILQRGRRPAASGWPSSAATSSGSASRPRAPGASSRDLLAFSRRSKPQRAPGRPRTRSCARTVSLVSHKLKLMAVEAELRLDADLPPRALRRRRRSSRSCSTS